VVRSECEGDCRGDDRDTILNLRQKKIAHCFATPLPRLVKPDDPFDPIMPLAKQIAKQNVVIVYIFCS
jgi:hypothetical protein